MRSYHDQLAQELQIAGASDTEVRDLLPIASRLTQLQHPRSAAEMNRAGSNHWLRILKPAAYTLSGLALGILLIVMSQTVSPTSVLFPVQKLSDDVAVHADPNYRAIVMMKRAQQVNQLVRGHASAAQVLAVLNDYTSEASIYKSSPHADYAAFEFCETNLHQAASAASPAVRKAIFASLRTLDTA